MKLTCKKELFYNSFVICCCKFESRDWVHWGMNQMQAQSGEVIAARRRLETWRRVFVPRTMRSGDVICWKSSLMKPPKAWRGRLLALICETCGFAKWAGILQVLCMSTMRKFRSTYIFNSFCPWLCSFALYLWVYADLMCVTLLKCSKIASPSGMATFCESQQFTWVTNVWSYHSAESGRRCLPRRGSLPL